MNLLSLSDNAWFAVDLMVILSWPLATMVMVVVFLFFVDRNRS